MRGQEKKIYSLFWERIDFTWANQFCFGCVFCIYVKERMRFGTKLNAIQIFELIESVEGMNDQEKLKWMNRRKRDSTSDNKRLVTNNRTTHNDNWTDIKLYSSRLPLLNGCISQFLLLLFMSLYILYVLALLLTAFFLRDNGYESTFDIVFS